MVKCLNEFEFWPDATTDYGVICPCGLKKSMYNAVATLASSFLIGSSSFLQMIRTCINAWVSLNFSPI